MELPSLGEHCSLSSCKQLDFLPFTCDACKNIYCKDHLKYDDHQCPNAHNKDRRAPVCPLCNQPISTLATDSIDQKVNEHIENDCKSDLAKHKRSSRCKVKGCKQHILVPVLCASCKQNFCLRHRYEDDHNCLAKMSLSGNKSASNAASVRAGQEAAKRSTQHSNSANYKPPQKSSLSAIGSELNRGRNERQQTPRTVSVTNNRNIPNNNMSEDQALALALQASLNETSFLPPTSTPNPQPKQLTRQEQEDMELARALQESEKDERERNRRDQQQPAKKESMCVIS